jgi:hypothetical protein
VRVGGVVVVVAVIVVGVIGGETETVELGSCRGKVAVEGEGETRGRVGGYC